MPSARYQVSIALTEHEWNRLRRLQEKKIKVIDVFRAGLKATEENIKEVKK